MILVKKMSVKNLFIGLKKSGQGSQREWASGEISDYRPDYWGTGGMGTDYDGNYSSLEIREGIEEFRWNDFPDWQHDGVGLAEIPLCN